MEIVINNQTVSNSLSTVTKTEKISTVAITPSSASPVLKSKLVIGLASDFSYTLNRDDFTVNATNVTNPSYIRYLKVIEVDDTAKTLTVFFGGAWSGDYQISIRHK